MLPDAIAAALPAIVTVGVCIFSLADTEMVITSPTFAKVAPLVLFDDMSTVGSVGTVSSYTILSPLVRDVTREPLLLARSRKSIVKFTSPSVSPDCIVYAAVQDVLLPETVAAFPSIVTVGSACRFSEEVNERVTISPSFAYAELSLFDVTVTADNVGTALSYITAELFVVAVTASPAFPVKSEKAIEIATLPCVSVLFVVIDAV